MSAESEEWVPQYRQTADRRVHKRHALRAALTQRVEARLHEQHRVFFDKRLRKYTRNWRIRELCEKVFAFWP